MGFRNGLKVLAYNIGGELTWVDPSASERIKRAHQNRIDLGLVTNEYGIVTRTAKEGIPNESKREMAAAGVAAEIVFFGAIISSSADHDHDLRQGGFKSIWEIQEVADELADRIESGDLADLFERILDSVVSGKGLSEFNLSTTPVPNLN